MDALILAGGENKRFPVNKCIFEINGRKVIDSNAELLKGLFDKIIISTNNPELYFYLDTFLIGDVISQRGPITGIYSALLNPDVSEVFVIACDMPFINVNLIISIIDKCSDERDAIIPVFGEKAQPLFGMYSKKIAEHMGTFIKAGKRSLREFLKQINVFYICEEVVRSIDPDGKSFININTLEDYHKIIGGKICLD
jgi:molybdopterin-guanine dinucleotide biosynthesis protein A